MAPKASGHARHRNLAVPPARTERGRPHRLSTKIGSPLSETCGSRSFSLISSVLIETCVRNSFLSNLTKSNRSTVMTAISHSRLTSVSGGRRGGDLKGTRPSKRSQVFISQLLLRDALLEHGLRVPRAS